MPGSIRLAFASDSRHHVTVTGKGAVYFFHLSPR
jgi:hypothetical protein